jgi:hypothetical protein
MPHGWGKYYRGELSICPHYSMNIFDINNKSFALFNGENLFDLSCVEYRNYDDNGINMFYEHFKDSIRGKIKDRLYQFIYFNISGIHEGKGNIYG